MGVKTKTLSVKGLEHGEREKLLFSSIDGVKEGELLRIVEFDPVPLVYMLNAREGFAVEYEKKGPDEWILNVKKTGSSNEQKAKLKQLLVELKKGSVSKETREKAKEFLNSVDMKTIGMVEQELIREGVPAETIRADLCDIHLEALKDAMVKKRIKVKAPHPIHTLMEEHKIIVKNLKELAGIAKRLKGRNSFAEMGNDLDELRHVVHHLVEAEKHHEREEEALFPKMEAHYIIGPPRIMKMDHVKLRKRKKELQELAASPEELGFKEFKRKSIELGEYLSRELESHIFKEDNILYQMALQALSEEEWKEVKKQCDKIGYCCFTPKK
ncbi:DUF438 domain-containing protein [Candidatus Micrarchaeota archaeon]|nr:DUF438 domain-containing protein [Candidatus Micrarchaeota archaeon]